MSLPRLFLDSGGPVVSAAVSGTITTATETDIVNGGETIIIDLTNDAWVAAGAAFNAIRQDIIDGLDASTTPTNGWNNEVRDKEVVTAVTRTSNTRVTITLSAASAYSVGIDEVITVTVPASALTTSGSPVTATPDITLTKDPGSVVVTLGGTAVTTLVENNLVNGGETLFIDLLDDTWVAAGATFDAQRQNIIDGLDAASSPANGWNIRIRDAEVVTAVVRTSDTRVTVTFTAAAAYDIASQETITVTVPSTALASGDTPAANPTFTVDVNPTVALTEFQVGRIFCVDLSSSNKLITFSGTYTGVVGAIQARVVLDGTSTEIVAWTTIDASPTDDIWSGTLLVPAGEWYDVQIRPTSDTTDVTTSVNKWSVGLLIGLAGQSNILRWETIGSGQTPDDLVREYDGNTWSVLPATAAGLTSFTDYLLANLGTSMCIGIINGAGGGTALRSDGGAQYWLDLTPASVYDNFKSDVDDSGGDLNFVLWSQGETEAGQDPAVATTRAEYAASFEDLIADQFRADFNNLSGLPNLPVVVSILGNYTTSQDDWVEPIRQAQYDVINSMANVYAGAYKFDLPMADFVHLSAAGFAAEAERMAQCLLSLMGDVAFYEGPSIEGYTTNSTTETLIHITHNAGTDFTPTSGITGFRVENNGAPVAISAAVRTSATVITLTHAAVTGTKTVRYAYGANPTMTGPVVDNTSLALPLEQAQTLAIAQLTATVAPASIPRQTVVGGGTITVTLLNDTFIAGGTGPIGTLAQSDAFVQSFQAAASPTDGWNNLVSLDNSNLTRDSDTQCTITIPATATYDPKGNEVITGTVQAAILTASGNDVETSNLQVTYGSWRQIQYLKKSGYTVHIRE